MALTKCKDCGREISKKAKACPHCGRQMKKEGVILKGCAILIVGFSFLIFILIIVFQEIGGQQTGDTSQSTSYNVAQRQIKLPDYRVISTQMVRGLLMKDILISGKQPNPVLTTIAVKEASSASDAIIRFFIRGSKDVYKVISVRNGHVVEVLIGPKYRKKP